MVDGAGGQAGGAGGDGAGAAAAALNGGGDGGQGGQQGGQGGQGGQQGGDGGQGGQQGGSWRDGLPDDLRGHEGLTKFKDVADLAKDWATQNALIGRKGVIVPGKDAKPEDWAKFYGELGRPESAEKYDFGEWKPPEGLPWHADNLTAMQAAFHKHGLTNAQAAGLLDDYAKVMNGTWQAFQSQGESEVGAVRQSWGDKADKKLEMARDAVRQFAPGDQIDAIERALGSSGAVLTLFATIGEKLAETGQLEGQGDGGHGEDVRTPEGARRFVTRIREEASRDPKHPYSDRKHPEHAALQQKMLAAHKVAGSAPAQG